MDEPCVDCGCSMVAHYRWRRLPEAYRRALLVHDIRFHMGRTLCTACYQRRRADDTVIDVERRTLGRDELLDEWHSFTKNRDTYTQNVKAFAEYLGRNFDAVEKALTRAGVRAERPWGVAS